MELSSENLFSWRKILLPLLLLGGFAGAWAWLFEHRRALDFVSSIRWLQVEEVNLSGEWPVTPDVMQRRLPELKGQNIFLVDPKPLVAELKKNPWVENVLVKKEYPSRLHIAVVPKKAIALLLERGQPFFLDHDGEKIERASALYLKQLNLPAISREENAIGWEMKAALRILDRFSERMQKKYKVSQLVLGTFPYFRVFLSTPQIEVAFSAENWEEQLPQLALLLDSPPNQIGQIQRINLYFPKKAVVRSMLSN